MTFSGFSNVDWILWARSIRPKRFPEIRFKIEWNSFRKFVSKISVHLSRLSFFLEIWKFRKFPVPFGISTRYESAPVPLAVKSYKMAASLSSRHYTGCKIICHSSSLYLIAYIPRQDLIFWKIVDWSFRISWGLVRSVSACFPGILSHEKSSQVALITRKWCLGRSGKYFERIWWAPGVKFFFHEAAYGA